MLADRNPSFFRPRSEDDAGQIGQTNKLHITKQYRLPFEARTGFSFSKSAAAFRRSAAAFGYELS